MDAIACEHQEKMTNESRSTIPGAPGATGNEQPPMINDQRAN
jgi:hypothetical protein